MEKMNWSRVGLCRSCDGGDEAVEVVVRWSSESAVDFGWFGVDYG
ncbi:hypothetical protein HanIR_Chr05g0214901 [Helianthus annuus]|nr:hypothetical protein HanIR_Chr05g0214901 [Helianthus annuus]